MSDVFSDRLEESYNALVEEQPKKVKVDKTHKFVGFDAYKKVIESGVDVVILATPPAFRPAHLMTAINAGKHVFCEKPVAVDAPGVRKVLEAAKKAKEKNLSLVSGFTFRYDMAKRECFDRISMGKLDKSKLYPVPVMAVKCGTSRVIRNGLRWNTSCATGIIKIGFPETISLK